MAMNIPIVWNHLSEAIPCSVVCEEDESNTFLFINTHLGAGVHQQAIQHDL